MCARALLSPPGPAKVSGRTIALPSNLIASEGTRILPACSRTARTARAAFPLSVSGLAISGVLLVRPQLRVFAEHFLCCGSDLSEEVVDERVVVVFIPPFRLFVCQLLNVAIVNRERLYFIAIGHSEKVVEQIEPVVFFHVDT